MLAADPRIQTCHQCGKTFRVFPSELKNHKAAEWFCGNDCTNAFYQTKRVLITCSFCGKQVYKARCFVERNKTGIYYCTNKCYLEFNQQNKVKLTCNRCNKEFLRIKSHAERDPEALIFCSKKCKLEHIAANCPYDTSNYKQDYYQKNKERLNELNRIWRQKSLANKEPSKKTNQHLQTCVECGQMYKIKSSQIKNHKTNDWCCSWKCYLSLCKKKRISKLCLFCNKEILVYKFELKYHKNDVYFCSNNCYRGHLAKNKKHDPIAYAREYYQKNREKIRQDSRRKEYKNQWCESHKTRIKIQREKMRLYLKTTVIMHYSNNKGVCACCGESELEFLTIDHINDDGAEHRRNIKQAMYRWLISNNFPEGYQVLCWNCNCAKGQFGVCPHQKLNESALPILTR